MSLTIIRDLSRRYGANVEYVLGGGGNTSYKDDHYLYVKPSGVALASIEESDFVKMDRAVIRRCFELESGSDVRAREEKVRKLMAFAIEGEGKRPSVEAPLHELLDFRYVVHLHPAAVNGMTCGLGGKAACAKLFPDALWVDYVDPGFTLARKVADERARFVEARKFSPSVIFLQNHGVFVGGDDASAIDAAYAEIMDKLTRHYEQSKIRFVCPGEPDTETAMACAPLLRGMLAAPGRVATVVSTGALEPAAGPLTPDHIVYAKSYALTADKADAEAVAAFEKLHGYKPVVVSVPGKALFAAGSTLRTAQLALQLAVDAAKVRSYAEAFGGARYLDDRERSFVENWEAESYRKKVSSGSAGRLAGKVAVVTGGAQGFGYGIAEALASAGASVLIADLNFEGASKAAEQLKACASGGVGAVAVNIGDEVSVRTMVENVVKLAGGIDLFVANAGVLKAGSVKSMEFKDFSFVTGVNYMGYFLCVKHVAQLMARQNAVTGGYTDIVQVNSKSGLVGSNKNGAYAGSKFGTIGLTQSFALELVTDRIKVNSVCPGNFFDGPLWSDPVRGLFVQYLAAGKVPGAQTVADVKNHYEKQIPMHRGCLPSDVAKAIVYCVEQLYETGQAIPVAGGQVMLN